MENVYRIRATDLFKRLDDSINEQPKRIIFLAVEGNVTEVDYFKYVEKFRLQLGINKHCHVEVIKRAKADTNSAPDDVYNLLCELVELYDKGIMAEKIKPLLPVGYDIKFIESYLSDPGSIDFETSQDFLNKLNSKGIDIAYFKYIAERDEEESQYDSFCILIDKDNKNHTEEQLKHILAECREKGYEFYLCSPCFELWLLFHLCGVKKEYENQLEDLKQNKKVSNNHTFISKEVSCKAGHKKHISEKKFRDCYLKSIDIAIKQSEDFEQDVENLINGDSIGTNLSELFSLLRRIN